MPGSGRADRYISKTVLAYHNQFFDQARRSFVIGAYYPALVSACALGERILNHLILDLRGFYKNKPEYRQVYRKESFDNWQIPVDTLEAWGSCYQKQSPSSAHSSHCEIDRYISMSALTQPCVVTR
jgi:hypothetical protein